MARKTALVVEDETQMGSILAEILAQKGYEATVMVRGAPAAAWVRQHKPDVVLLDLMLPDKDGFAVCQELKLDRQTNLIPVIMVTALDRHEDLVRGLRVGANFYLTKPFGINQLHEALDRVTAWREEMTHRGAAGEVHFQFQSDTHYLEELNQMLSSLLLYTGLPEAEAQQLTTAVRELGCNAIEWGHRRQRERVVTVTYRIEDAQVVIVIRDEGEGFDPASLPHAASEEDPVSHMEVRQQIGLRPGGYGILLSRGLVDELEYNQKGNEVRLVKRLTGQDKRGNGAR